MVYMLTFGYIWGILMVNVTIYSIHGSYGYRKCDVIICHHYCSRDFVRGFVMSPYISMNPNPPTSFESGQDTGPWSVAWPLQGHFFGCFFYQQFFWENMINQLKFEAQVLDINSLSRVVVELLGCMPLTTQLSLIQPNKFEQPVSSHMTEECNRRVECRKNGVYIWVRKKKW